MLEFEEKSPDGNKKSLKFFLIFHYSHFSIICDGNNSLYLTTYFSKIGVEQVLVFVVVEFNCFCRKIYLNRLKIIRINLFQNLGTVKRVWYTISELKQKTNFSIPAPHSPTSNQCCFHQHNHHCGCNRASPILRTNLLNPTSNSTLSSSSTRKR